MGFAQRCKMNLTRNELVGIKRSEKIKVTSAAAAAAAAASEVAGRERIGDEKETTKHY